MNPFKTAAALAPALMLAACGQGQAPQPQPSPTPSPPANAAAAPSPAASDEAGTNADAVQAPPLVAEADRGETGARDVLLDFARAIELRRFDRAWALLSPDDQRKWSREAFAALFADLGKITVAVPTGEMEGAAGSSYYTAPVTITGPDKAGRRVRYEGKAVLRRANDVDGATPAQRRWRFTSLTLDWTH